MEAIAIQVYDNEIITVHAPYRCVGRVRGSCGHSHKKLAAARKCCERDQRSCAKSIGLYSDRCVRDKDGTIVPDMD